MSDNEYTIDLSNMDRTTDTIDITCASDMSSSWVSVGDVTTSTIDIDSIIYVYNTKIQTLDDTHWADSIIWEQVEFEDHMPSVAKVEDMCKDYPALAKAYENFKTIYAMVHQDWKGNQDNEETPF